MQLPFWVALRVNTPNFTSFFSSELKLSAVFIDRDFFGHVRSTQPHVKSGPSRAVGLCAIARRVGPHAWLNAACIHP
jgi:hypothetical protein